MLCVEFCGVVVLCCLYLFFGVACCVLFVVAMALHRVRSHPAGVRGGRSSVCIARRGAGRAEVVYAMRSVAILSIGLEQKVDKVATL